MDWDSVFRSAILGGAVGGAIGAVYVVLRYGVGFVIKWINAGAKEDERE